MRGITIRDFFLYKKIKVRLFLQLDESLARAVDQFVSGDYIIAHDMNELPQSDICFIDQYTYTEKDIGTCQKASQRLVVFDELAKIDFLQAFRKQDIIVRAQLLKRQVSKADAVCGFLEGLPYFVIKRKYPDQIQEHVRKQWDVLVVLGGGAGHGEVYQDLSHAFFKLDPEGKLRLNFVLGANAPPQIISSIKEILPNANVQDYVSDLVSLMRECDVGIVSGGYSKYEAAYAGLPVVSIAVQDHQIEIADVFCQAGGGIYAGDGRIKESAEVAVSEIGRLLNTPELKKSVSQKASQLIDGQGLERILNKSMGL